MKKMILFLQVILFVQLVQAKQISEEAKEANKSQKVRDEKILESTLPLLIRGAFLAPDPNSAITVEDLFLVGESQSNEFTEFPRHLSVERRNDESRGKIARADSLFEIRSDQGILQDLNAMRTFEVGSNCRVQLTEKGFKGNCGVK